MLQRALTPLPSGQLTSPPTQNPSMAKPLAILHEKGQQSAKKTKVQSWTHWREISLNWWSTTNCPSEDMTADTMTTPTTEIQGRNAQGIVLRKLKWFGGWDLGGVRGPQVSWPLPDTHPNAPSGQHMQSHQFYLCWLAQQSFYFVSSGMRRLLPPQRLFPRLWRRSINSLQMQWSCEFLPSYLNVSKEEAPPPPNTSQLCPFIGLFWNM